MLGGHLHGRGAASLRDHPSTLVDDPVDKGADLPANYPPEQLLEVLRKTYTRYAELAAVVALGLSAAAAIVHQRSEVRARANRTISSKMSTISTPP